MQLKAFGLSALFFFFFLFGAGLVQGQDLALVRKNIEKLCSKAYFGRGYLKNGQNKAARFIASEFEQKKLLPFGQYFQPFHFDINTFPKNLKLKCGKKSLQPGKDFIPKPNCPLVNGSFEVMQFDTLLFNLAASEFLTKTNALSQKAILLPAHFEKQYNEKIVSGWKPGLLIFEEKQKLTFSLSETQSTVPAISLLKEKIKPGEEIKISIEPTLIPQFQAENVIGYIPGKSKPDSFLVVSAHYDHLGGLGKKVYFPGANDNASGTSMLLALADYYAKPENRLPFSLVFMAFAAEEAGLIGSSFYVLNPLFPLSKIKFLVNCDLLGTGEDGITVVNGSIHTKAFDLLTTINRQKQLLSQVVKRGKAANSDHFPFSEKGVPAFFIYTRGGIDAYHDVFDVPETLPLTKFKEVFTLITEFLKTF